MVWYQFIVFNLYFPLPCRMNSTIVVALVDQKTDNFPQQTPDLYCQDLGLCDGTCSIFTQYWPTKSPDFPTDGGVIDQRRRLVASPTAHRDSPGYATVITFSKMLHGKLVEKQADDPLLQPFYFIMKHIAKYFAAPCEGGLDLGCDIHRVFDEHLPLIDNDNDTYSTMYQLRGADWRGKDCNDQEASIRPGVVKTHQNPFVDANCNGISGVTKSGTNEDVYCSAYGQAPGIAVLGDSVSAHFHIPPQYINAASLNFSGVIEAGLNEVRM